MRTVEEILKEHKRICWYPSAGADFRSLLFLSEAYCKWKDVPIKAEELPDLFLYTDVNPVNDEETKKQQVHFQKSGDSDIAILNTDNYKNLQRLFQSYDGRTTVTLNRSLQELESLNSPQDAELCNLPYSSNFGKAFLMDVHVKSNQLGEFDTNVVYVITENTWFAFEYLLKRQIFIDYIIRVRYGDNFGGSKLKAEWLLKLINPLHVRYFISSTEIHEDSLCLRPEDRDDILNKFPESKDVICSKEGIDLGYIYDVPGWQWSHYTDMRYIGWYKNIKL